MPAGSRRLCGGVEVGGGLCVWVEAWQERALAGGVGPWQDLTPGVASGRYRRVGVGGGLGREHGLLLANLLHFHLHHRQVIISDKSL